MRIGGAVLLGTVIVLGAFLLQKNNDAENTQGSLAVVSDSERSYIETSDSNGNGVPDWEENLSNRVFSAIEVATSTDATSTQEGYTPPTTFTGKFAEAFFKDYMSGKLKSADGTIDTASIVDGAVKAVETNTTSKEYTPLDVVIVPDSKEAVREYGNALGGIIISYPVESKNELTILQEALQTEDPEILKQLIPLQQAYAGMIQDTLLVSVPESFVKEHLMLLTAYEAILLDIQTMQNAFLDPLYTLARVKRYQNDAAGMSQIFVNLGEKYSAFDVYFTESEPGSLFYATTQ